MIIDLSTEDGYNIASAIRGPDIAGEDVFRFKLLVIARLRYLAGIHNDQCFIRISPLSRGDHCALLALDLPRDMAHCIEHAIDGARSIANLKPDAAAEMGCLIKSLDKMLGRWRWYDIT